MNCTPRDYSFHSVNSILESIAFLRQSMKLCVRFVFLVWVVLRSIEQKWYSQPVGSHTAITKSCLYWIEMCCFECPGGRINGIFKNSSEIWSVLTLGEFCIFAPNGFDRATRFELSVWCYLKMSFVNNNNNKNNWNEEDGKREGKKFHGAIEKSQKQKHFEHRLSYACVNRECDIAAEWADGFGVGHTLEKQWMMSLW